MLLNRSVKGFAALLVWLALAVWGASPVRAEALEQGTPPAPDASNCRECHWDIYVTWEGSAHGRGLSCGQCHLASQQDNHARLGHGAQGGPQQCMGCHTTGYDPLTDTWQEDNIHCSACHKPLEPDHPNKPMPTNKSVELCGQCHIQARFEWEASQHGQAGVACVSCHNQHKTNLRTDSEIVSDQCAICHEQRTAEFTGSIHAQQGVSCGNCHLAPLGGQLGEGNAKRDHTFDVDIATCVACHVATLHKSSEAMEASSASLSLTNEPADAMASGGKAPVSAQPASFSPLGFLGLAVVAGASLGAVVTLRWSRWNASPMEKGWRGR